MSGVKVIGMGTTPPSILFKWDVRVQPMVSQARVSGATSNLPQEEIATLQVWQDNKNLPTQVRNFARKPQQHLVNDADAMDRYEDDFFS
jgi:hypothetical protein